MLKIYNWPTTDEVTKKSIMDRAMLDISSISDYVAGWIKTIQNEGDAGLLKYIREFDNKDFELKNLRVSQADK